MSGLKTLKFSCGFFLWIFPIHDLPVHRWPPTRAFKRVAPPCAWRSPDGVIADGALLRCAIRRYGGRAMNWGLVWSINPKKLRFVWEETPKKTVNLARFHFFLTTSFSVLESRHTPHQLVAGRTRRLPAPAHGDGHDAEGHQHQTDDQPDEVKVPWCRTWAVGVPSGLACQQRCFCISCGPNWLTTIMTRYLGQFYYSTLQFRSKFWPVPKFQLPKMAPEMIVGLASCH